MTARKVAVSVPADVLSRAREEVESGRAKSLSAIVSAALDEKLRRDELRRVLDEMDAEHGKPSKKAQAWAKRVLGRSSSTRGR